MPDDAIQTIAKAPPVLPSEAMNQLDILQALAAAASNPKVDTAKMEQLMILYERIAKQQREEAYAEAMARCQQKIPQIDKNGRIEIRGNVHGRYAKLEDIDLAIKPIIAEEGFSTSFNEVDVTANQRRYSCKVLHRRGHFEMFYITLDLDTSGSKNNTQSAGSTFSYAKRYLLKNAFSIVEKDEDQDGVDRQPITEEQLRDLETLLTDSKANKKKFMEWAGIQRLADLPTHKLADAMDLLNRRLQSSLTPTP